MSCLDKKREIEIVACKACAKKEIKEQQPTINDSLEVFYVGEVNCKSKHHGRNK